MIRCDDFKSIIDIFRDKSKRKRFWKGDSVFHDEIWQVQMYIKQQLNYYWKHPLISWLTKSDPRINFQILRMFNTLVLIFYFFLLIFRLDICQGHYLKYMYLTLIISKLAQFMHHSDCINLRSVVKVTVLRNIIFVYNHYMKYIPHFAQLDKYHALLQIMGEKIGISSNVFFLSVV